MEEIIKNFQNIMNEINKIRRQLDCLKHHYNAAKTISIVSSFDDVKQGVFNANLLKESDVRINIKKDIYIEMLENLLYDLRTEAGELQEKISEMKI